MPKGQYYSGLLTDNESVQSDYLGGMLDEPTPEELQAMGGGLSRYLLADIPGGLVDTAAQGLSYGAEGFKNLLPEDLSGYDLSKILGVDAFQESMQDPVGGRKSLERLWESLGVIPPPSDLPLEQSTRSLLSLLGSVPFGAAGVLSKGKGFQMLAPPGSSERVIRKIKRAETTKQKKIKNPDYKEPGSPKNNLITLQPRKGTNLPAIQIGGQTTKGWIRKIEGALSRDEIIDAYEWYRSGKMLQPFLESVGEDLTPEIRAGMLVASQGKSPTMALGNYMRQREQVKRGIPFDDPSRLKSGTADSALYQLAQGEPITGGAGQMIFDFVDAALQNKTRTYYNNDARAGAPFVVDRHTARDFGLVDPVFMSWLKKNYKIPKGSLTIDFDAAPSETSYEFAADQGRKITGSLNKMGWGEKYGIGELDPGDVQAIGWTAMSRLYSQPGEDIPTAIAKNIQRVSAELAFGQGSPFDKKYGEQFYGLTQEQQYDVTRKGMSWISDRANELAGTLNMIRIHGSGGWTEEGVTSTNPAMVENLLSSPEGADLYANIVGYLAQQTEVWAHRPVSQGSANSNGLAIDILEEGTNLIQEGDNLKAIWKAVNEYNPELFQGYQPLVKDGNAGIRILVPFEYNPFKSKTELRRYFEDNNQQIFNTVNNVFPGQEIAFTIEGNDVNIRMHKNDWTEKADGKDYLERISERTNRDFTQRLRTDHRSEFETFLQKTIQETTGKTHRSGIPPTAYQARGIPPGRLDPPPVNSPPGLSPPQLEELGLYSLLK